jgi:mRNA interferase RelE/StbE
MNTEFLRQFDRDIDKLSLPSVKKLVAEAIQNVEKASKFSEIKDLKKLKGSKNAYRIKIGDYRIGVFLEKNTIEFARVVHRKDIYKVFP